MFKFKKWLAVFALFLVMLLVACAEPSDTAVEGEESTEDTNEVEAGDTTTTSGDVETVPVGYTGPLSGAAAYYGEDTLTGLEVAVNEINENGGFEVNGEQYEFELISLDDEYLPDQAANNAKRLVQEYDSKIIFNPHSGGIYAMQVFNEVDDFIIGAYTSEPGIIEQGNSLTWRIPPGYDTYIDPFTDYQMDRFGDSLAVIAPNSQYGVDWAEMLVPAWEEKGGEVVFEEFLDFSTDTDYYTIVTNALENDPDVLFIGGASQPTALVAEQARDLGFEGGFLIMDQAKIEQMADVLDGDLDLLEGSIGTLPLVNSEYPGTDRFVELYEDTFDKSPGAEAGLHYVSLHIFADAMEIAGSVDDTEAIHAALDEAAQNLDDKHQAYTIRGVGDQGENLTYLNVAAVEDGEIEIISNEGSEAATEDDNEDEE